MYDKFNDGRPAFKTRYPAAITQVHFPVGCQSQGIPVELEHGLGIFCDDADIDGIFDNLYSHALFLTEIEILV